MKYASFWQRFTAGIVDFIVLLPFLVGHFWLLSFSREVGITAIIANFLLFSGYDVFCHAKWGQTAGKWLLGIKVTKLDGSAIGWREATIRNSVLITTGFITAVGTIYGLVQVPDNLFFAVQDAGFSSKSLNELIIATDSFNPVPGWFVFIEQAWIWSEMITMLFNDKRRAIHDYLAGTVVIRKS